METQQEVETIRHLHSQGRSQRAIACELGCSSHTVKRYLDSGGLAGLWTTQPREPAGWLHGLLQQQFQQHHGNAEMLRQKLQR